MTSFSGLFNDNNPSGHSLLTNKMPVANKLRRVVHREGFRALRELFDSLIGAASGGAASATHKRIKAEANLVGMGGNREIETVTDINRNTDAADVTELKRLVVNVDNSPTFPADLSGNGGSAM